MTGQSDPVDDHEAPSAAPSAVGACAHDIPWRAYSDGTGCPACDQETARLRAAFAAGVAEGRWDRDGYEPKDYKPLARVQAHRQMTLYAEEETLP